MVDVAMAHYADHTDEVDRRLADRADAAEAAAGVAREVELLLDEMHAPTGQSRKLGHDVVAIAAGGDLRGVSDEEVFARAMALGRVVVTENVVDVLPIARSWTTDGRSHAGLLLTSPRRFSRARSSYPGDLIAALDRFLHEPPIEGESWVWWLR